MLLIIPYHWDYLTLKCSLFGAVYAIRLSYSRIQVISGHAHATLCLPAKVVVLSENHQCHERRKSMINPIDASLEAARWLAERVPYGLFVIIMTSIQLFIGFLLWLAIRYVMGRY